jgi:hypothetical protein
LGFGKKIRTWSKNDKTFKPDGKQNTKSTKQAYEFSVDRVIETTLAVLNEDYPKVKKY